MLVFNNSNVDVNKSIFLASGSRVAGASSFLLCYPATLPMAKFFLADYLIVQSEIIQ
jgi:hypothetical protein